MAILPNSNPNVLPTEECRPATTATEGPKAITLEQYFKRQQRRAEAKLTAIPLTQKPKKKRGGRIVRLRRRLAYLKGVLNSENPPEFQSTWTMWEEIDEIENELHNK